MATTKNTNTKELVYTVEEEIAVISEQGTAKKKLTLMAWGDNSPKYDLRTWVTRPDGAEVPKKGITLDYAECKALCAALTNVKEIKTPEKKVANAEKEKAVATKATKGVATTAKTTTTTANAGKKPRIARAKSSEKEDMSMSKEQMAECLRMFSEMLAK